MFNDASEFEARLAKSEAEHALVYLACHGVVGESILDATLGPLEEKQSRLVLSTLAMSGLPLVRASRSVVFINACHAGRFFADHRLKQDLLHGFPDLFLRENARGVIATVGEIDDRFAAELARDLLRSLSEQKTAVQPLPALLRDRRAAILRNGTPSEQVFAFMYVYYGNPRVKLRIVRA